MFAVDRVLIHDPCREYVLRIKALQQEMSCPVAANTAYLYRHYAVFVFIVLIHDATPGQHLQHATSFVK